MDKGLGHDIQKQGTVTSGALQWVEASFTRNCKSWFLAGLGARLGMTKACGLSGFLTAQQSACSK
jgi:hypothetical protein